MKYLQYIRNDFADFACNRELSKILNIEMSEINLFCQ